MSSIAKVNMVLIASKGLLPTKEMEKVFHECINDTNYLIENGHLLSNGNKIGIIKFGDRIVIQTYSSEYSVLEQTKELRNLFTRRAEIALQNYQNQLEEQINEARKSITNSIELTNFVNELHEKNKLSAKAYERQQKDNCLALKEELIEEALNQGYDVIDNSKEEIQLQFVKRIY